MKPVHPRARGEHYLWGNLHTFLSGSSPRSRGTSPSAEIVSNEGRFIPALAGNIRGSV